MKFDVRYANHPGDSMHYDTRELREKYLFEKVFAPDDALFVYSHQDRIIAGGVMPVFGEIEIGSSPESREALRSEYLLERREMGFINIGGAGYCILDGKRFDISHKDGMYISMGTREIAFGSLDSKCPAKFYINSAPAHRACKTVLIRYADATSVPCGADETVNKRVIHQYLHPAVCETCQLAMGMTELAPGSVWNTMPCHTHERRMEVYMYFDLPEDGIVFHLMGEKTETRHIVMHSEQAVISPSWSIHSGVGTASYTFIWGMCGENQTFTDMDNIANTELK